MLVYIYSSLLERCVCIQTGLIHLKLCVCIQMAHIAGVYVFPLGNHIHQQKQNSKTLSNQCFFFAGFTFEAVCVHSNRNTLLVYMVFLRTPYTPAKKVRKTIVCVVTFHLELCVCIQMVCTWPDIFGALCVHSNEKPCWCIWFFH